MTSSFPRPSIADIPEADAMMMNDLSGALDEDLNADLRNSFRGIMEETFASASSSSGDAEANKQGKPDFRPFASLDDNNIDDCFGLDLETAAATEPAPAVRLHELVHEDSFSSIPPRDQPSPIGSEKDNNSSADSSNNTEPPKEKKPQRPLSAYNLFFQLERERLIAGIEDTSFTAADVERVAIARRIQMQQDKPKRKHRRSHGKISFAELARTIANRWKGLEPDAKELLRERAGIEKARYLRELEEWTNKYEVQKPAPYLPPLPLSSSGNFNDAVPAAHVASMNNKNTNNHQFAAAAVPSNQQRTNHNINIQYVPSAMQPNQAHSMSGMSSVQGAGGHHNLNGLQPSWEEEVAFNNLQSQQDALNRQVWAVENEMESFQHMQRQQQQQEYSLDGIADEHHNQHMQRVRFSNNNMAAPALMDPNYENYAAGGGDECNNGGGMTLTPAEAFDISGRTGVGPSQVMMMFEQMKVRDNQARRTSLQQQQQQRRFSNANMVEPRSMFPTQQPSMMQSRNTSAGTAAVSRSGSGCAVAPHQQHQQQQQQQQRQGGSRNATVIGHINGMMYANKDHETGKPMSETEERQMSILLASFEEDNGSGFPPHNHAAV